MSLALAELLTATAPPSAKAGRTLLPLFLESDISAAGQPVTVGLPFPCGELLTPKHLCLRDAGGNQVPVQTDCLARWADGAVKWLLCDFMVSKVQRGGCVWTLEQTPQAPGRVPDRVRIKETRDHFVIDTGTTTFWINRHVFHTLDRVVQDRRDLLDSALCATILTDGRGRRLTPRVHESAIEAHGPVRATIRLEGEFPRGRGLRFRARLSFFAGADLVRLAFTVHNPNRARHRGGLWDLGDPGSVLFRDLSLDLSLRGSGASEISWIAEPGQPPRNAPAGSFEIYQDSSGGANWQSRNHVNRQGVVPCSFRGYRLQAPGEELLGLRANPVVGLATSRGRLALAVPEFWQQFPKAIEVNDRTLRVRLFPGQFNDLFELQGGEQKTHTIWFDFSADESTGRLNWTHAPVRAHASPAWYAASGAIPYLPPNGGGPLAPREGRLPLAEREGYRTPLETLLAEAVQGENSLLARREIIDEYGWRHFGDLYADHEGAYYAGSAPVISHYNNQYDVVYGAIMQYLRTGDARWCDVFGPLARHVIDIDIYHTTRDRAAYNGGLFWHTDHYRDASTATHRAYSRANQRNGTPYGGGPGNEHNYTTGLLHYAFLTGDPDARQAVLSLADWVIGMDDGARNLLGLIDDGRTGLASATTEPAYHGPGRGCGNSVNALLDGWLLTASRHYLTKAEELIRRAIHPKDDVAARRLLDTERRWSYTVFLSVLDRYLQLKREAGEIDFMYVYARASLVHYARWMAHHEAPYFDHPEKLEYPTETWAAQELRKANVLRLAAAHAEQSLRARLLARGNELADRAWCDLMRFRSRTVTRALALVMIDGPRDEYLRTSAPAPLAAPTPCRFGAPTAFEPQRTRVLRNLKCVRTLGRVILRLVTPRRLGKLFLPRKHPACAWGSSCEDS